MALHSKSIRNLGYVGILLLAIGCLGLTTVQAETSKRLILKDGSYQVASKWEIKGDRVRYWSSERFEWEDVPTELVDWKATEAYNSGAKQESENDPELARELAEEAAEQAKEDAKTPTVAPGVKLPAQGGVFLLDDYQGKRQIAEVVQSGGEVNKQTGKNILRAAINPLPIGSKQSIELKGTKARVQSHTATPQIFIDIDQDTQEEPIRANERFRLVRMQLKKDSRVVGNLKIAIWGKVSEQHNFIDATVENFSGDWVRITPKAPLENGEYAIVELLGDKKVNLYVWDFGVNPDAPANPTAWRPEPVKNNSTGTDMSPVLIQSPKAKNN